MKRIICLALAVVTVLALFTGCSGRVYTDRNGSMDWRSNTNGNVSTSKDGTVNGGRWYDRNYRSGGTDTTNRKHGQRTDIGAEVEFGK